MGGSVAGRRPQKYFKVVIGVFLFTGTCLLFSIFHYSGSLKVVKSGQPVVKYHDTSSERPECSWSSFTIPPATTMARQQNCLLKIKNKITIKDVPLILSQWRQSTCRDNFDLLSLMYNITLREGKLVIDSPQFREKVIGWLGGNTQLYKQVSTQSLVSVYNHYTREETVFNPLRAKRPLGNIRSSQLKEINKLDLATRKSCDFCRAQRFTARDADGRLETPLSITAANTFRYRAIHQLILPKQHHAINWNLTQLIDMFELGERWLKKQFNKNSFYKFPVIDWDLLPPGGASQYHPHLQAMLTADRYPGVTENWRRAAIDYHKDSCRNFFTDFISIHDMFGLTVRYKSAVAIATLTPKKENEVVIIGKEMDKDYLKLLYAVLRAFIDDKRLYTFTLATALSPLSSSTTYRNSVYAPPSSIPAFTRVITRGKMSELRSDISALEMFTFFNVNSDPFTLVQEIQKSVEQRLP